MKRLSSQLTYANVIATLCLFLLVGGGTAFAATQLGKDSVGSKQLKKNSVIASKIKNGTITGSKIRLSTLGAVPSATTASHAASADSALKAVDAMNAETLGGQSAGQLAGASRLHCPSGMALFGGLCYQEQTNAPAEMGEAVIGCARASLRLPTRGELLAFDDSLPVGPPLEWTEPEFTDGPEGFAWVATAAKGGGIEWDRVQVETLFPYICVIPASN